MNEWEYFGPESPNAHGYYLTEGLINIWWNTKLSARKDFHADPPKLQPEVLLWLQDHPEVKYAATPLVGPPMWVFPTIELREEFKSLFLETKERMEEIIQEGITEKRAQQLKLWEEQGRPRDEKNRPWFRDPELPGHQVLLFPDPEGKTDIFG